MSGRWPLGACTGGGVGRGGRLAAGGAEEGNLVVAPAASLRPLAEWKMGLRPALCPRLKPWGT